MSLPTLPVSLLDDGRIACGDYPDWAYACHSIETNRDDREILEELLRSIPEEGVLEPLLLGVRRRDLTLYLSDGHHRAVALIELGIKKFPYRWFWKSRGLAPEYGQGPVPEWVLEGVMAA